MSRIFGHLCIRNEADRYLADVLGWHGAFLDAIHVYDDQSDDASRFVARELGAVVTVRLEGVPSFFEDESRFRSSGWELMEASLEPTSDDWILCLDADEFFVSPSEPERRALERMIFMADLLRDVHAVDLRIDEIFDVVAGVPMRRTDGFWGGIHGVRLVRFQPDARFRSKAMGGGSVPTYAAHAYDAKVYDCSLLHYGYATAEDRAAKYQRYSRLAGNGHNPVHIESILTQPVLRSVHLDRVLT